MEESVDLWAVSTDNTDKYFAESCREMETAFNEVKALLATNYTQGDLNKALRDLFGLGMDCGGRFMLRRVIDRVGEETILKVM